MLVQVNSALKDKKHEFWSNDIDTHIIIDILDLMVDSYLKYRKVFR